jgi:ketosteroid isomerase-like protein
MATENVEILRRANAAFNRGEVDALLELLAPDAEFQDLANAPDQSPVVKGGADIRGVWTLWRAAFDELRTDIDEYIDRGDAVICAAHWQGEGKASGISIDVHQFDLYEFCDGSLVRMILGFGSKDEALEAAGLSE